MTPYWLTPFADSFVNSDWLEFVIYFHTNEQGGELNAFTFNFSDNSDLRGVEQEERILWPLREENIITTS